MLPEVLQQWDLSLLLALNGSDSTYLDGIMWTVTKTATWIPLFLGLFWLIVKNNDWRRSLLLFVLIALLILVADQVASGICKPYFQRFRPTRDPLVGPLMDVVNGYRGGKYGFFSSHASNTFAGAMFFSLLFRHRRAAALLFGWAALSSYSRMYLGVHYPSDIAVGLCFGLFSGAVFHRIYTLVAGRFLPAALPQSAAYTASGYRTGDFRVFYAAFAVSLVYILANALRLKFVWDALSL